MSQHHFNGTYEQLVRLIASLRLAGDWKREPNGVHRFLRADGTSLHFSTGKHPTVWFDGPGGDDSPLAARAIRAIEAWNEAICRSAPPVEYLLTSPCTEALGLEAVALLKGIGLSPSLLNVSRRGP